MGVSKSYQEDREQRILDAAANLVMRQGYDKTTMSDVADEVGVSRGIVYRQLYIVISSKNLPIFS